MISLANAFEPSSRAGSRLGPNTGTPLHLELVDEPGHQRRLGPDDDEVDARLRRGGRERDGSPTSASSSSRLRADAGVAGRADELGLLGRAGERAHERVLAPTGADDEDLHAEASPMGRIELRATR